LFVCCGKYCFILYLLLAVFMFLFYVLLYMFTASPAALAVVARILGGDLAGALGTPAGPLATEVTDLATAALEGHLEHRLRVPRLLERAPH
jgi:hypothetical protein